MEWGTLSTTQPLVSATTEDRPPLEVRFVNESSAHLTVSWVDAAGRLRHGRRCAPGAGPLRVRDGSVRPEHVEGTFAGDAFVVYAGPGDGLAANADVVAADAAGAIAVAGWYAASDREPARGRVVRVADGPRRGPLDWLRGTPRGLAATAGAASAPGATTQPRYRSILSTMLFSRPTCRPSRSRCCSSSLAQAPGGSHPSRCYGRSSRSHNQA